VFTADRLPQALLLANLFHRAIEVVSRARELVAAEEDMRGQYQIIAHLSDTALEQAMSFKGLSQKLEERVRQRTAELAEANLETIYMLAVASEARDEETGQHVRRIQRLAREIALQIGMTEAEADALGLAAILHDVGKIHIPDSILKKPGPLTDQERAAMQEHTIVGERILGDNPYFAAARRIARSHHENFDGSGYPDRADGQRISMEARIVHLADVYDALTNPRGYKPAWTPRQARDFIEDSSGRMFDPQLVKAFAAVGA